MSESGLGRHECVGNIEHLSHYYMPRSYTHTLELGRETAEIAEYISLTKKTVDGKSILYSLTSYILDLSIKFEIKLIKTLNYKHKLATD